ncbi:hypothetical protein TeGR_g7013, partial [Tetraparma gracilis]
QPPLTLPPAQKEIIEPSKKAPGPKDRKDTRGNNTKPANNGKREFERKSGTGRGREVAKGGAGGHNWGSEKDAAREGEEAGADKEEEKEKRPPREPSPETFSYDQYLAKKKEEAAAKSNELFKAQKLKTVDNEFAAVKDLKIEETDFLKMGTGKALRKKNSEKKEVVKIDAAFRHKPIQQDDRDDDAAERADRGGRGGGRGGRGEGRGGRGEGRGGRGGRGRGDRANAEPGVGRSFSEGGRGTRMPDDRRPAGGRGGRGGRGLDVSSAELFPALA